MTWSQLFSKGREFAQSIVGGLSPQVVAVTLAVGPFFVDAIDLMSLTHLTTTALVTAAAALVVSHCRTTPYWVRD